MNQEIKIIDLINLHLYDREIKKYIEDYVSQISTHVHTNKEILDNITSDLYEKLRTLEIDGTLINDSTNPVQSKVIQRELETLRSYINSKIVEMAIEPHKFSIVGEATSEPVSYDGTNDVSLSVNKIHATGLYLDSNDTLVLNGDSI